MSKRRVKILGIMLLLLTFICMLGGCGIEGAKRRRERDERDLRAMIEGEDAGSILERRASERNSITSNGVTIERSGFGMKTVADALMWLENLKYYLIVGIPISIGIGIGLYFTLGKTSMIFKKMASFMVVGVPIFCVVLLFLSVFLKGVVA